MTHKQLTIQDIAAAAGVSKTTISRYLNGKYEYMSEETRVRIAAVISETSYRPNRMANGLKTKKSGLIGFVMSNVMDSQTPRLLASICEACARNGKKIIVINSEKDPEKERAMVYDLLDQRIDGLLVASGYNAEFYQKLDQEELPVVLVDRVPRDVDIDSVAINHTDGTRRIIKHLIDQGFERIVILKRRHRNPNNTPEIRVCAAKELCREHFKDDRHCVEVTLNSGYQQEDVLRRLQEVTDILGEIYAESQTIPTAVFVAEAVIMNIVSISYYRNSLAISPNFTIAGYSERDRGGMMITPAISTIEQPLEQMGQLATERLIHRIDKKDEEVVREKKSLSCFVSLV